MTHPLWHIDAVSGGGVHPIETGLTSTGRFRPQPDISELMGTIPKPVSTLVSAAVIGVTAATCSTCGVGLVNGTKIWCALPTYWLFGFPVAIATAIVLGLPLTLIFWKLRLVRWWQFGMAGFVCAIPAWTDIAEPFTSARWAQSGFYDALNYLGSGLAGGLAYWWICQKVGIRSSTDDMARESDRPA